MLIPHRRIAGFTLDARLFKGGGGSSYYGGLEKLYEQQAAQGAQLQQIATNTVYPAYGELMSESKGAGSQANQEQAASRALADSQAAITNATTNVRDEMTASGVDPTDPRYARTMANIQLSGAAQGAAAATGARDKTRDLGYAKRKDAVGMGMGVGSDAVSALSAAGGTLGSAGNMQMGQNLAQAQGQAAVASLGSRLLFKSGGMVRKCYAGGGYVNGKAPDPMDYSSRYNTALPPAQEQQFQAWAQKENRLGDLYDYDMRGAWRDMQAGGAGQAANGHFTDRYKKPNHPTFSDQSMYHGVDGVRGGTWGKSPDGRDTFTPGGGSLWKDADLQQYFKEREPEAVLQPRAAYADGGRVHLANGGGILGAMRGIRAPAAPTATAATANPASNIAAGIAGSAGSATGAAGRLGGKIEWAGEKLGSRGMQDFGRGMAGKQSLGGNGMSATGTGGGTDLSLASATPQASSSAPGSFSADYSLGSATAPAAGEAGAAPAMQLSAGAPAAAGVEGAAGNGLGTAASMATTGTTAAAEAAGGMEAAGTGLAAAGEAAAGGAAATGLGAVGSAVGAAMPWVGGAMLLGSALGLFRDGGKVRRNVITPNADDRRGGDVRGPGGPKDDKVPAMLSDGEFVMPVGSVHLFGPELERMRQAGLQYEKEAGIQ